MDDKSKRIAELSKMLNNAKKDRAFEVEDERDSCERAIQALIDDRVTDTESDTYLAGVEQALRVVQTRKDPAHSLRALATASSMFFSRNSPKTVPSAIKRLSPTNTSYRYILSDL